MLKLETFGAALRNERIGSSYSVANLAKHTGGISKEDIRDFEAGKKIPDKLTIKKLVHCFPILTQFENDLRHGNFEAPSEVRQLKPKRHARPPIEPTRLQPPPKRQLALVPRTERPVAKLHYTARVVVETVNPKPFAQPLAPVLTQALRKTRAEMLTELTATVKKRLSTHSAEDHDFTIKNDGKALIVKLQVSEGARDEDGPVLVDSGCYLTVGAKGDGLAVFCKAMTSGSVVDSMPRLTGVARLLEIAGTLHSMVKDRRFE